MRVAIVALNAYPLIEPSLGRKIGGLETFAWNLAQGLAKNELDQVQFLVRSDHRCPSRKNRAVQIDCIHEPCREIRQSVSKSIELNHRKGFPRIKSWDSGLLWKIPCLAIRKFFFPRYSEDESMAQAIAEFTPDLIVSLGINQTSAMLGNLAMRMRVPIALWLQSNADLDRRLFEETSFVDRYGVRSEHARECLTLCRNIVCQTQTQYELLQQVDSRYSNPQSIPMNAIYIPNPIDVDVFRNAQSEPNQRHGVLWIGRADRFHKRPLIALEIAARCPDISFLMILNPGEDEVYREIIRSKPANVTILDFVPSSRMPERMANAWLFLSTGSLAYEGFPNVLLESLASGTPIVSMEDFDEFLSRSQGGLSGNGDIEEVVNHIRMLRDSPSEWAKLAKNGFEFIHQNHERSAVVKRFRNWIACLIP